MKTVAEVAEAISSGLREGVPEGIGQGLVQAVWFFLAVGQILLMLLLGNVMGDSYASALALPLVFTGVALTIAERLLWDAHRGQAGASYEATRRLQKIALAVLVAVILASSVSVR